MLLALLLVALLSRLILSLPLSIPKYKLNPSNLTILYGGCGSGKSTYLTLQAVRAMKSGIPVYSNVPIKGAYQLKIEDIGHFKIEPNSLLIVDEVGSVLNNRDFKGNFQGTKIKNPDGSMTVLPSAALTWWKQHRHEQVECIVASQGFDDMDKKLQTLGSHYYIVRNIKIPGFPIIFTREIRKKPDIDELTHQPVDGFFFKLFGWHLCLGRFCWKYFDSFSKMNLPSKEWHIYGEEKDPIISSSF